MYMYQSQPAECLTGGVPSAWCQQCCTLKIVAPIMGGAPWECWNVAVHMHILVACHGTVECGHVPAAVSPWVA